jgi:lipid-A-disaccharide synthase
MPTIYLIAGEPSGDLLGGKLMRALKQGTATHHKTLQFAGIGGETMQEAGLESLFPMEDIALLGFAEILPHLSLLRKRLQQTIEAIHRLKPDVVVTIDSPGFNFRVARACRALKIPLIHYVAPTVWAYRPKRAAKIAAIYDHLLVLLPFEPPYFEKEGLKTTFVGHPIVEDVHGSEAKFREHYGLEDGPILCVLPGSRRGEVVRLLPIFHQAVIELLERFPDLQPVLMVPKTMERFVRESGLDWHVPVTIVSDRAHKEDVFAAATVALTKSGTVSLELAYAKVPMVVGYKVHPFSAWLLRRMVQVPYASLVNIIMQEPVITEHLQEDCTAGNLARSLTVLLEDQMVAHSYIEKSQKSFALLGQGDRLSPSEKAANVICSYL